MTKLKTQVVAAALTTTAFLLASCADSPTESNSESTAQSSNNSNSEQEGHGTELLGDSDADAIEVDSPQARIVTTYDGGVLTLDGNTLEVLDDAELPGFNRVNAAGDQRHVFISTGSNFQLLDTGAWTIPHGDHTHSYTTTPKLTDTTFDAPLPGHVVQHAGQTIAFSDGDGKIQIFDDADLRNGQSPSPDIKEALEPHHGVAVALEDGTLVHTLGTEDARTGAVAFDSEGNEIVRSEECPSIHGEAVASGETVGFGCEDGVLLFKDGEFSKVDAPDPYGRAGTLKGSEESPVLLGDYKVDKDADNERPTRISLTNTETGEFQLVDLGVSYTSRSLGRGPSGEAVVLGTDGALHIIDPDTAEEVNSFPVIDEWEEPEEWQTTRPSLFIQKDRAYVTNPDTNELHIVDLSNGNILNSAELPETPNELTGVVG